MTRKPFKRNGMCGHNPIETALFFCEDHRSPELGRASERMAFQIDRLKKSKHAVLRDKNVSGLYPNSDVFPLFSAQETKEVCVMFRSLNMKPPFLSILPIW